MAVTVKKGKNDIKLPEQHVIVVDPRPAYIESADVAAWKSAVNQAKNGMPQRLFRLYENILADGVLSSALDKRTGAITNAEITFINKDGEPDEVINELIDSTEFEALLTAIMEAKAWGISVVDMISIMPLLIYSVPRRNLHIKKKLVVVNEYDESGMPYAENPFIFEVRNRAEPLGFLFKSAIYVIYKRGGFGDWSEFVEIFGMPFRVWKYSMHDNNTRQELINALQLAGSRLNMLAPKEAELEQKEATSNTDGSLFDKFVDRCDKEILISILGQTMTTQAGSSKSQSETHKDVEEDINKSDRRFVRRVLNTQVLPILERMGLPVAGGRFIFPEQGESISTSDRVDMALKVKENGIPVSDELIYEISGLRAPNEGETVSRTLPTLPPAEDPVKEKGAQAKLSERIFSFFAEALSGRRAPLKF